MKNRIAEIRKASKLSQQKFADRLGLTKNFISLIETGKRVPSDRTIADICREFYVNEDWLRAGTGEMRRRMNRTEEIELLLKGESDDFRHRLVSVLSRLDFAELKMLENVALKLAAEAEAERKAQKKLHIVKIAGRDGSFEELALTDDEYKDYVAEAGNYRKAPDDL